VVVLGFEGGSPSPLLGGRALTKAAFVAALWLVPGAALAQDVPAPATAPAPSSGPEGRGYAGVVPGARERPAHLRGTPGQTPVVATWPGFQPRSDGASRFFVQLTAMPSYDVRTERGRVVVSMRDVRIGDRQARRPLDTRYFSTPVTRAYLERRGRNDCALVLELRAAVAPSVTVERGEDGMVYLMVSFPPGRYLPEALEPRAGAGDGGGGGGEGSASYGYVSAGAGAFPTSGAPPSPRAVPSVGEVPNAARPVETGAQAMDAERPPALRGPRP
jgi:hypothetical protein